MNFTTSLREYVLDKITEFGGAADLIVGIPSWNSEETIGHVFRTVAAGLEQFYPGRRAVIVVADGGSVDDTRERVQKIKLAPPLHKIVMIYRGLPGKGTALRAVFEAGARLGAKACAVFDSDLRSITPEWIPAMLNPVLDHEYDFVAPYYVRHKFDGTITNNVAYPLTRALYGRRIRQPIGGDFAVSPRLLQFYSGQKDVWQTDVARFGVDIWMTTTAVNENFRLCQAHLGAKIHDPKDPAASLGPMFRQVAGTLFSLMEAYEPTWKRIQGSEPVPLLGTPAAVEAPPVEISLSKLASAYRSGFDHFSSLWREVVNPTDFPVLELLADRADSAPVFPPDAFARIVYDFAYTFQRWARDRFKLVELMTPIYYGRIAAFVRETREMSNAEAEAVVEAQAETFEREKAHLLQKMARWETKAWTR